MKIKYVCFLTEVFLLQGNFYAYIDEKILEFDLPSGINHQN